MLEAVAPEVVVPPALGEAPVEAEDHAADRRLVVVAELEGVDVEIVAKSNCHQAAASQEPLVLAQPS